MHGSVGSCIGKATYAPNISCIAITGSCIGKGTYASNISCIDMGKQLMLEIYPVLVGWNAKYIYKMLNWLGIYVIGLKNKKSMYWNINLSYRHQWIQTKIWPKLRLEWEFHLIPIGAPLTIFPWKNCNNCNYWL